jgi:Leucine-rich repeat (LRR) protein
MRSALVALVGLTGCGTKPEPQPPPAPIVPPIRDKLKEEPLPLPLPAASAGATAATKHGATAHEVEGGYEVRVERDTRAADALAALAGDPAVVSVGIENDALTDADLKHLSACANLQRVALLNCPKVTGAGFAVLAPCSKLKALTAFACALTDDAPRALAALAALEELNLDGAHLSDAGLRALAALPALEVLSLEGAPVSGTAFAAPGWANLRELNLARAAVSDEGCAAALALPLLARLSADRTPITDAGLVGLARAKNLVELSLSGTRITDVSVRLAVVNENLRALDVSETHTGGGWLAGLAERPKLRKLSVARTKFDDAGAAQLVRFPNLSRFDASGCEPLTDKGLAALGALKALTAVELSATAAGDDTAAALAKLPQLTDSGFARSKLTDAGAKLLASAAKLRVLDVRGTRVSREGAERAKMGRARLDIRTD